MARNFSNTSVATTLSAGIAAGDLNMVVALATGYPTVPFAVVIDPGNVLLEEIVLVTAVAGTTWTVTRAYDGTAAVAHSAAAVVRHSAIADDFRGKVIGQRDMATTAPSDGQAVVWSAAGSTWQPGAPALSGAAGGVLFGTYPNPGFAADMATQAELDAEASTRAAADAAEASARAAADAAHAALTTSAHGGIVASTDPRLTDARTPTAHAASHASAGSDPVSLAASQIGSGTLATARLGSGTADNTTFLRGDQTWATPAGGGTVGGTGTAGRMAQWVVGGANIEDSTLIKSGAGVLTLSAASPFTLTVPATGTAALLGTAQTFTANQRIDAAIGIGTAAVSTSRLKIVDATYAPSSGYLLEVHADDASPYLAAFFNDTYSTTTPAFLYYSPNNGNFQMGTGGATQFQFFTNGAGNTRLSIDSVGALYSTLTNAYTGAVRTQLTLDYAASSGTPAAGDGNRLMFALNSSTTASNNAASIVALWDVATHAIRSADLVLSAYYISTAREFLRGRGGSSNAQIGFLGATPISRQSIAANATDLATAIALANDLKAKLISFGLLS